MPLVSKIFSLTCPFMISECLMIWGIVFDKLVAPSAHPVSIVDMRLVYSSMIFISMAPCNSISALLIVRFESSFKRLVILSKAAWQLPVYLMTSLKPPIFFAEALCSMRDTLIGDKCWKRVSKAVHISWAVLPSKIGWCASATSSCMMLVLLAMTVSCFSPSLRSAETNVLGLS